GEPGHTVSTRSEADGSYILALPAGQYRIRFQREGFATRELRVAIRSTETHTLDATLEVAQVSENVIVTANAQPLKASQMPAPVDVVTHEEIRDRQSVSIADALATQSGVAIARTGREGGLTTFFLDGGNSNFTKFFLDGAPINVPGGFINLSNQTLDNI